MTMTRKTKFGSVLLALGSLLPIAAAETKSEGVAEVEGSIGKIKWGDYWAGPKLRGTKSLEGKVVLLKIWGG